MTGAGTRTPARCRFCGVEGWSVVPYPLGQRPPQACVRCVATIIRPTSGTASATLAWAERLLDRAAERAGAQPGRSWPPEPARRRGWRAELDDRLGRLDDDQADELRAWWRRRRLPPLGSPAFGPGDADVVHAELDRRRWAPAREEGAGRAS